MKLTGTCACGKILYRLNRIPMYVNCCHCRWCQRETGAAFALNAMIETINVEMLSGEVELVDTPSESGGGQKIARCPSCQIALWSHYAGAGDLLSFIRVGTLDSPDVLPPDVHIFTQSKQPWVVIPDGMSSYEEYYDRAKQLPAECLDRLSNLTPN